MRNMPSLKDALEYTVQEGLRPPMPIFPVFPRKKEPLIKGGFHKATTDPKQIREWWKHYPDANLGLCMPGVVILDVDCHSEDCDGAKTLRELEREHGELPETWIDLTPTGGAHYFFKCDDTRLTVGTNIASGIDYRGSGGYVLIPPSVHPNGGVYEWDAGHNPSDTPLADLPDWLRDLMLKTNRSDAPAPVVSKELPPKIQEGDRNDELFRTACSLRAKGLTADEIMAAMQKINERCVPPLSEAELKTIVESASKYNRGSSLGLEIDKNGLPTKTIENFFRIFTGDPFYSSIRFNELTNSAEITVPDRNGKQHVKQMDDADDAASMRYVQTRYKLYQPVMHEAAMKLLLRERAYNPLCDLVDSFEWDGQNRIEHFLTKWMKVEDSPYTREVSRLIFAGGIHRLYSPGCKFDDVPVLVGTEQGEGKSTIVEWLALNAAYFKVIDVMDGSQKSIEGLTGLWFGEIAELSAFRKSDIEALKSFITRTSDQYRPPYGRKVTVLPRRIVFIGTTNSRQFLTDKSGNRRFYPVEVHSNGYDLWQAEAEVREYIAQCWAEARERYKAGTIPPYADRALIKSYREAQAAAEIDDWRVGVIEKYLSTLPDDYPICIKELFRRALYPDSPLEPKRSDQIEIAQIMDKMADWIRCEKREQTRDYGRQRCWKRKSVHLTSEVDSAASLPF